MPAAGVLAGERSSRDERRRSGFTLIETMVSLAILSIGLIALVFSMMQALKYTRQSRSLTHAMYLAQQQIESFHSMPGADVVALTGAAGYPSDPNNPIDPDPGDADATVFTRRWFIQPDTPEEGIITVSVEVDWVDQIGVTRTIELHTMKSDQ